MANAHTEVISLCVKHPGEQSREQRFMLAHCFFISSPWSPSVLAFRSVEGEHVAEKKSHLPYRAAWGTGRCAKEKHPLYGYALITSFLPTKHQLLRIPHQHVTGL